MAARTGAAARVMEAGGRATGTGAAARVMEAGERVMEAGGRAAVAAAAGCTVEKLNRHSQSKRRPMGNQRGLHTRSRPIRRNERSSHNADSHRFRCLRCIPLSWLYNHSHLSRVAAATVRAAAATVRAAAATARAATATVKARSRSWQA